MYVLAIFSAFFIHLSSISFCSLFFYYYYFPLLPAACFNFFCSETLLLINQLLVLKATYAHQSRRPTITSKMRPHIVPAIEVMNVLNTVSEMSTPEVQSMLEKVIETLGSTELFRPHIGMGSEDEIKRELMEGLMVVRLIFPYLYCFFFNM